MSLAGSSTGRLSRDQVPASAAVAIDTRTDSGRLGSSYDVVQIVADSTEREMRKLKGTYTWKLAIVYFVIHAAV